MTYIKKFKELTDAELVNTAREDLVIAYQELRMHHIDETTTLRNQSVQPLKAFLEAQQNELRELSKQCENGDPLAKIGFEARLEDVSTELNIIETRDELAYRLLRGESLDTRERAMLVALNQVVEGLLPAPPPL